MGGFWAEQLMGARCVFSMASVRALVAVACLSDATACTLDFDRFKPSTAPDATMVLDGSSGDGSSGDGSAAGADASGDSRPDRADGGDGSWSR
jgi:hypothetical protein